MHIIYTIIYTPQIQPLAYWSQPTFLTGWPSEVGDADPWQVGEVEPNPQFNGNIGNIWEHDVSPWNGNNNDGKNTWTGVKSACSRVNNHGMGRYSTKLDSDIISDNGKKLSARKQPGVMIPSFGFCTCLVFHLETSTWMLVVCRSFGPQAKSRVSKNM